MGIFWTAVYFYNIHGKRRGPYCRYGISDREENDCYMYKVQDVTLKTSLLERIFGLGTIICYTGDTTNPQLVMAHIKNARAIKDFILEQSEIARRKRRTMNTLDIGADGSDFDIDN